jgi:flagellar basal body P-ring formation protein FlgA
MNLPNYLNSYLKSCLKKFSSKQLGVLFYCFCSLGISASVAAQTSHNLLQLRQQAESYLANTYKSDKNERLEIRLGNWDRRLNLAACQQDITFSLQDTAGPGGNVTLNCQCKDSPGWAVHLSAQVDIYRQVPVATKSIGRGNLIDLADIRMETRNISQLAEDSLLDNSEISGKAAKRMISQGDVIRPALLDQPKAVSRGENVTITSKSGSIQVVMQGTAMTDGKLGQQIRVKNNQSERIISARVVGQSAVEIL